MNMTGNTILITGGGTGIGRALAEAFHRLGNKVIITGRRQAPLDEVIAANPGIEALTLDVQNAADIAAFPTKIAKLAPHLNVLINNAGIMVPEQVLGTEDYLAASEALVTTNLLGPIRLTAALLPLLRAQPQSSVVLVSSGLAFVPMASFPTYSATKAALHSYSWSLRHQLRGENVEVIELIPPYVQTTLIGEHQASDPNAMPLDAFITEVMSLFAEQPSLPEIIVERCKMLRFADKEGREEAVFNILNP